MTLRNEGRDDTIALLDDEQVHAESEIIALSPPNRATTVRKILNHMTEQRKIIVVGEDGYPANSALVNLT